MLRRVVVLRYVLFSLCVLVVVLVCAACYLYLIAVPAIRLYVVFFLSLPAHSSRVSYKPPRIETMTASAPIFAAFPRIVSGLSPRDWNWLLGLVDNPPQPNDKLQAALKRYNATRTDDAGTSFSW